MINKKVQIQMARIKKEVNQVNGIQGQLMVADEDKNPFHYQLFLEGPKGSLYENGKFLIDVHYHKDHPFMPPRIKFITPIQHINILDGRLYLLILKEDWSLAIIFQQVVQEVKNILIHPDEDNPLNIELLQELRNDREKYKNLVQEHTFQFAQKQ